MKKCAIIIPVYKVQPTQSELASFRQCLRVLKEHPVILVTYRDMKLDVYNQLCKDVGKEVEIRYFDIEYFSDISGYNELLTSLNFYKTFSDNEYILIYQLDAWVFRDELEYWCNKGFDYIGAPWFEGYAIPESTEVIGGGNGGFSLRKVQTAIGMLNRVEQLKKIRRFWYKSRLQSLVRFEKLVTNSLFPFSIKNKDHLRVLLYREEYKMNEDYFWSYIIPGFFWGFHVSTGDDSGRFSLEVYPSLIYQQNGSKLPFGCHAWEKYEPEFWKEFINIHA